MASWVVRSSPKRAVRVRTLTEEIVLCTCARHLTLTVPLSTQVYKLGTSEFNVGVSLRWTDWHPIQGGVQILVVASC